MAARFQNQPSVPDNFKKQLALTVRSIQWSYGIFWSISGGKPGVLEWGSGYYNGDIKTRKTMDQSEEKPSAEQLGEERSEQLRELFEFLSGGEPNRQGRRLSVALSPEDLTDTEWYYLVCMSFVFNIGEGLPGRTLANGEPLWICNAHLADKKTFCRSLLARSASIQTVVCFPFLEGVIEIGMTDLVLDDPRLVHRMKASLLEIVNDTHNVTSMNSPVGNTTSGKDDDSNELIEDHPQRVDEEKPSMILEFDNDVTDMGDPSLVKSWHGTLDELLQGIHDSMNPENTNEPSIQDVENLQGDSNCNDQRRSIGSTSSLLELPTCTITGDDEHRHHLHYQSIVSTILKTSQQFTVEPHFRSCLGQGSSSFVCWNEGQLLLSQTSHHKKSAGVGASQKVLKWILCNLPQMHQDRLLESRDPNHNYEGQKRQDKGEITENPVICKSGKRRKKKRETVSGLRSFVSSKDKDDKLSTLEEAIEYVEELGRRVDELEASFGRLKEMCQDLPEFPSSDSDGYLINMDAGKSLLANTNKRKAPEAWSNDHTKEGDANDNSIDFEVPANGNGRCTSHVVVTKTHDDEIVVELKCPWREGLLLEVMQVLSNFNLDFHSVQSSTTSDGLLLIVKSKPKIMTTPTLASAAKIKHALHGVAFKC